QYSKITDFTSNFFAKSGKICDFAGLDGCTHLCSCKS
ncbi:MAG: hypothetical protein ACI976_001212, partial [Aureispira sp.]